MQVAYGDACDGGGDATRSLIRTKVHGPVPRILVPRPKLTDRHAPRLNLTVIPGSSGLKRRRAGRPGAAGAQREIGDTVFLSFNTVKTH